MWFLNNFKLTPLDERYTSLEFEWLEYSYIYFMSTPDPGKIRDIYLSEKAKEPDAEFKKQLKENSGLDPEVQKEILRKIGAAG